MSTTNLPLRNIPENGLVVFCVLDTEAGEPWPDVVGAWTVVQHETQANGSTRFVLSKIVRPTTMLDETVEYIVKHPHNHILKKHKTLDEAKRDVEIRNAGSAHQSPRAYSIWEVRTTTTQVWP